MMPKHQKRAVSLMAWIAFGGIVLGTATLIMAMSVLDGFEKALYRNALQFTSHIQVQAMSSVALTPHSPVVEHLRRDVPMIASVTPFVRREALIRTAESVEGIVVKAQENQGTVSASYCIRGRVTFLADSAHEVVISERLARRLKADTGTRIILYSVGHPAQRSVPSDAPSAHIDALIDQYTVAGIYQTGIAEYDDMMVFMPYGSAIQFFRLQPTAINGIDIMLHDRDSIESVRNNLLQRYGAMVDAWTMYEIHSTMFSWIALQQKPIPIVLALIMIVAVFNVIATLLMTIVEKIPSIGILRSMGMPRRMLVAVFVVQGSLLSLVGSVVGCLLGGLCTWIQYTYHIIRLQSESYYMNYVPVEFAIEHYVVVLTVTICIAIGASLIPALIAARLQPIRSLRFRA